MAWEYTLYFHKDGNGVNFYDVPEWVRAVEYLGYCVPPFLVYRVPFVHNVWQRFMNWTDKRHKLLLKLPLTNEQILKIDPEMAWLLEDDEDGPVATSTD